MENDIETAAFPFKVPNFPLGQVISPLYKADHFIVIHCSAPPLIA